MTQIGSKIESLPQGLAAIATFSGLFALSNTDYLASPLNGCTQLSQWFANEESEISSFPVNGAIICTMLGAMAGLATYNTMQYLQE